MGSCSRAEAGYHPTHPSTSEGLGQLLGKHFVQVGQVAKKCWRSGRQSERSREGVPREAGTYREEDRGAGGLLRPDISPDPGYPGCHTHTCSTMYHSPARVTDVIPVS